MNLLFFFLALSACILAACATRSEYEREQIASADVLMSYMTMRSPFTKLFQTGNRSLTVRNVEAFLLYCERQSQQLEDIQSRVTDYKYLNRMISLLRDFTQESREWIEAGIGDRRFYNRLMRAHRIWLPIRLKAWLRKKRPISLPSASDAESISDDPQVLDLPIEIQDKIKSESINLLKEDTRTVILSLVETCQTLLGMQMMNRYDWKTHGRLVEQIKDLRIIARSLGTLKAQFRSFKGSAFIAHFYELEDDLSTIMDVVHGIVVQNEAVSNLDMIPPEKISFAHLINDCEMGATQLEHFLVDSSIVTDVFYRLENI